MQAGDARDPGLEAAWSLRLGSAELLGDARKLWGQGALTGPGLQLVR